VTLPPPKALVFDWDNTLVDTWSLIHKAYAETFAGFGLPPWSLEEVRSRVRASARDSFPALFGEAAPRATALFYESYERLHIEELQELPGAGELLSRLRELEIFLAVVSNKTGPYLRKEASFLGWDDFFGSLLGAGDAPRDKPAPDPVVMALADSGLALGPSIWFVGDTDIDMLCAANAGGTGILLRADPPGEREFAEAPPSAHAASFDELLTLID
jgi:phosphoglycolate phosphatase